MKLSEFGTGKAPTEKDATTKDEAEAKVLTLAHAKVSEKQAKNLPEAVSLVLKENNQLRELVYGKGN